MPNGKKKKKETINIGGVKHERAGAKMEKKIKESGAASAWKSAKKAAMDKAYSLSKSFNDYASKVNKQKKK